MADTSKVLKWNLIEQFINMIFMHILLFLPYALIGSCPSQPIGLTNIGSSFNWTKKN